MSPRRKWIKGLRLFRKRLKMIAPVTIDINNPLLGNRYASHVIISLRNGFQWDGRSPIPRNALLLMVPQFKSPVFTIHAGLVE